MTTYYKLVMNGTASGQDVRNIFYYRTGPGVDMTGFIMAGAEALAGNFKQEVWPKIKWLLCDQYTLETIDVTPINNEFELMYQMPYSLVVGETGYQASGSYGVSSVINFKFQLEPTTILNGINPPKRGYVALGPIPASMVGEDGYVTNGFMNVAEMTDLRNALAANIEQVLPVPQVWFPVRLKQTRILGGLIHWESVADIKGCVVSRRASFRRSRMPES